MLHKLRQMIISLITLKSIIKTWSPPR